MAVASPDQDRLARLARDPLDPDSGRETEEGLRLLKRSNWWAVNTILSTVFCLVATGFALDAAFRPFYSTSESFLVLGAAMTLASMFVLIALLCAARYGRVRGRAMELLEPRVEPRTLGGARIFGNVVSLILVLTGICVTAMLIFLFVGA